MLRPRRQVCPLLSYAANSQIGVVMAVGVGRKREEIEEEQEEEEEGGKAPFKLN